MSKAPTLRRSPEGGWIAVSRAKRKLGLRGSHPQRWIALSALSQLAFAALAVFGYFYTVRPVYQNQLLAEQKARLEMEGEQLRKENTSLSTSIENDKQKLAMYDVQIADLEKKLTLVEGEYKVAATARSRIEQELSSAKTEESGLLRSILTEEVMHVFESFPAFVYAKMSAAVPSATSAFTLITSPEGSDLMKTVRAYIGDPYLDSRNLIVDYFDPENKLLNAPEVVDPLRAEIKKSLLDALDALATKIAIPEHVFEECGSIVVAFRIGLKPITDKQKALSVLNFSSTEDYLQELHKLSQSTLDLQNSAMEQLDSLKATQYAVYTVMPLVYREASKTLDKFIGNPGH